IKLVRKRCSHFAHQSDTISMRHFFALNLYLKGGLLLRANIKRHADCFQKVPVVILQTTPSHDYPTCLAIRQKEAVLALERRLQGAAPVVLRFNCCAFIRMYARKNQITRQRQVRVEAINATSFIAHPSVAFWIQNPESKIGRLRSHADTGITLPQNLLLPLTINRDSSYVGCDIGQPIFLRTRSPFFLAIHCEGSKHIALWRKNWGGPARSQSADPRELTIVGPQRISHYILHDDGLVCEHGGAAGTVARSDRRAVHFLNVRFGKIWRRAVADMFSVAIQKEDGTTQSFRLAFHEKNKLGQDLREWRVSRNHFQDPTLSGAKEFFLFDSGEVATNDHATQQLAACVPQWPACDSRPKPVRSHLVSHKHLNIVDVLAANGAYHRQLIVRKGSGFVRQVEPVILRPFSRWRMHGALSEHAFGSWIKDKKIAALIRDDDGIAHVR